MEVANSWFALSARCDSFMRFLLGPNFREFTRFFFFSFLFKPLQNPFCWECMKLLSKDHEAHSCVKVVDNSPTKVKAQNELKDYSACIQGFDEFMKKGKILVGMRPEVPILASWMIFLLLLLTSFSLLVLFFSPQEIRKQREYDYMKSDSFSNHRFYEDALDVLIDSSRVAKYSYVFQFFSREDVADSELFRFNQQTLVDEVQLATPPPSLFFTPQIFHIFHILTAQIDRGLLEAGCRPGQGQARAGGED